MGGEKEMPLLNIIGQKLRLRILRAPRFKKPYTLYRPLPWDAEVYGKGRALTEIARRDALYKACEAFKKVAHATAGLALADRMYIIGEALRGKSWGGRKRKVYPRLTPEELRRKVEEVKALV